MIKTTLAALLAIFLSGANSFSPGTPDAYTGATEQVNQETHKLKPSKLVGQWGNPEGVASYCEDDGDTNPSDDASIGSVTRVIDHIVEAMEVRDMVVTFTDDGHVSATVQGNTIEGEYKLDGDVLTVTSGGKTFPVNVRLQGKRLSFFYPLSKCPQQVRQYFRDIPTEGLCLGIRFYRK